MFARKLQLILATAVLVTNLAAAASQPVAAGCNGEPQNRDYPRWGRLKHDPQWMEFPSRMADPDWPRTYYLNWYPETVPLYTGPHSGDGQISYSKAWLEYLRDLQPSDAAATWITTISAGLFNRQNQSAIPIFNLDQLKVQPIAESISAGGNVVKIQEIKNGSARIETVRATNKAATPSSLSYQNKPWLVSKFTAVSIDGQLGNAAGRDVYFPILSKPGKNLWVELKRVELFPMLPMCVVLDSGRAVYSAPRTGNKVTTLAAGQSVTLFEYMPQASNVWARVSNGWILIEYLADDGTPVYPTSWTMKTHPPIIFP